MNCKTSVSDWQESISALADDKFFGIIRMYLGEIKTPYNKQRLIEQLAGFIKNEENSNNLVNLLDEFDIKVITAICHIYNPTKQNISDFFTGDYTMAELYTELSNLVQRLILFTKKDPYSQKEFYYVNPLLWEKIEPYIGIQKILVEPELAKPNTKDVFSINPNFITAFISYLNIYGCSCKSDGVIKKNTQGKLLDFFPGDLKRIQALMTAFINLNLVYENGTKYALDYERFELFANLPSDFEYAFICAASCSRFSREGLKKEAQLFLDCIYSIPKCGYTAKTIIKLAFLAGTFTFGSESHAASRFSQILQSARQESSSFFTEQAGTIIERMLDAAINLGMLELIGFDKNGEEIYVPSQIFTDNQNTLDAKVLNIDSAFTVSLLPGLELEKLLPLTKFLSIKRYGVVSEFEITRASASVAFDFGMTPESIIKLLEDTTAYEIPQNLLMCIQDWYNTYASAIIYHGYVLKVSESNIAFVENNPKISRHIKEKLSKGIYLLDIPVNVSAQGFIEESGLDFMGKVKSAGNEHERISFPVLRKGNSIHFEKPEVKEIKFNLAAAYITKLKEKLKGLKIDEIQLSTLKDKINQRVIINEEQLSLTHIRTEILEAEGTNYAGKVHLIESAINAEENMEIIIPQFSKDNEYFTLIGKPLGITKQTADSIVRVEILPDHNIENFVVSRITHLRRLRF